MNIIRGSKIVGRYLNRNLPSIFTWAGIIGLGTSVYLTAVTAPKVRDICKDLQFDDEHQEESKTKVVAAAKMCLPVVAVVSATATCMIVSNRISAARYNALGVAYNKLSREYTQYQAAVIGALGGEAHQKVMGMVEEQNRPILSSDPTKDEFTFYDSVTRLNFTSTYEDVMNGIIDYQHLCATVGYVSLNEYCDCLGIGHVTDGERLGWDIGELSMWTDEWWNEIWLVKHTEEDGNIWFTIRAAYRPTVDGVIDADDPVLSTYALENK